MEGRRRWWRPAGSETADTPPNNLDPSMALAVLAAPLGLVVQHAPLLRPALARPSLAMAEQPKVSFDNDMSGWKPTAQPGSKHTMSGGFESTVSAALGSVAMSQRRAVVLLAAGHTGLLPGRWLWQ